MLERRTSRNLKLIIRIAIVSCIAVIALNADPGQTEPASKDAANKDCLSSPGTTAPEGSHWYYRINRTNNRRCWYLGQQREKSRQAVAPAPLVAPQIVSNGSEPPSQRATITRQESQATITRQESQFVGTRAENQTDNPSEISADVRQPEPFRVPSELVTSFSEVWPSLPRNENASTRRLPAMQNSFQADPPSTQPVEDETDEMPLIWPINTETIGASFSPTKAPEGATQHMLPWLIVVLGLMGVLVGLIYRFATPRRQSREDPWDAPISVARIKPNPIGGAGAGPRSGRIMRDPSDAALRPSLTRGRAENARASLVREDSMREFEESLREIVNRRRPSAA